MRLASAQFFFRSTVSSHIPSRYIQNWPSLIRLVCDGRQTDFWYIVSGIQAEPDYSSEFPPWQYLVANNIVLWSLRIRSVEGSNLGARFTVLQLPWTSDARTMKTWNCRSRPVHLMFFWSGLDPVSLLLEMHYLDSVSGSETDSLSPESESEGDRKILGVRPCVARVRYWHSSSSFRAMLPTCLSTLERRLQGAKDFSVQRAVR
ncbi:hypothetical protein R3P38DRAFT_1626789 [Favolaschia claudopus]|uniref:Uncharacterized protein n=1 Tax=Favolaschia claudopus TaxID=2862362 RepID=A0AAW0AFJ8_9AGAR